MAKKNFLKNFKGQFRKVINKKVKEATVAAYRESLTYMEEQLLNHPLSKELISKSSPSSYFAKPNGTLFGLMGFKSSRNPVFELLTFLKGANGLRYILSKGITGRVFSNLLGPSGKDLASGGIILDEWGDGRSWPEVVEEGIPGLSNFLVSDKYARSKLGFQVEHNLNEVGNLNKIKYLSSIFRNVKTKYTKTIIRKLVS
jgi:hypothetical protein